MEDELKRFGVSMEAALLEKFDTFLQEHAYTNRSEGIRDLIRKALVQEEWTHDRETVGAITIVYDHHTPELNRKLTNLQHDFPGQVVASLHVHLDHDNCMEVIVSKGRASDIKRLSDKIIALRGVLHGTLTGSTIGGTFKPGEHHQHDQHDHEHPHPHPHPHGSEDKE